MGEDAPARRRLSRSPREGLGLRKAKERARKRSRASGLCTGIRVASPDIPRIFSRPLRTPPPPCIWGRGVAHVRGHSRMDLLALLLAHLHASFQGGNGPID